MSSPRWDDEMKFELLRLKSELRPENFRVLSTPLGIGMVQDAVTSRETALYPSLAGHRDPNVARAPTKSGEAIPPLRTPEEGHGAIPDVPEFSLPSTGFAPSFWQRGMRRVLIHSIDLGFVGFCLFLGFVMLAWVLDPSFAFSDWPSVQLLWLGVVFGKLPVWMLPASFYAVFLLYWLVFRVILGATLGESCLHNFCHTSKGLSAAPGKASTER